MEITITTSMIIEFAALISAISVIVVVIKNYAKQIEKWNSYDKKIEDTNNQVKGLKSEQYMQTKVLLAVLDGLHQQGCNGKVTQATEELTEYLNKNSHN